MLFDDRLATVLRTPARGETGVRTQFRQLLDLLGSMPERQQSEWIEVAYQRLGELADATPAAVQSEILRAPGLRLRNRALVAWLARREPHTAAAAMATAQLSERDWLYLIPRLPMTARGFLRHRRDLPPAVREVLERLGVRDLVLPEPAARPPADVAAGPAAPPPSPTVEPEKTDAGIGALVRRIEAFQRARREGGAAPRLPLEDGRALEPDVVRRAGAFDFSTDASGVVDWADPAIAPLTVGLTLGGPRPGAVAELDEMGARELARRLPLRDRRLTLVGLPEIAGVWRIDAAPFFRQETGQFAGYRGRLRRLPPPSELTAPASSQADRMRQLLHELRTPVNAIQGFAELIQQQMFGSAPNEYRALAAAIAVDAARLMAGFDEIDRLAKLETGALQLEPGESDWREVVATILRRLDGVLRPRGARIELTARGSPFTSSLAPNDARQLAWRLLATLAGAASPGEVIELDLGSDGAQIKLEAELPAGLRESDDLFAATASPAARAVSAGMFGTGFTLRLARAEAAAAGGGLVREGDRIKLWLPVEAGTGQAPDHHTRDGASAA